MGSLCGADKRTKIVVLRVETDVISEETRKEIPAVSLCPERDEEIMQPVIAIGSPSGDMDSLFSGTITSVAGELNIADAEYSMITTDMVSGKDGGGILLNMQGQMVGLIVSDDEEDDFVLRAVATSQIGALLEKLTNGEKICYAGIIGSTITMEQSQRLDIPQGVYVDRVEQNSPAMTAGIQKRGYHSRIWRPGDCNYAGVQQNTSAYRARNQDEGKPVPQKYRRICRCGIEYYNTITLERQKEMRFINELHEGDRISGIYLCKQKQSAMTKNGKPYDSIIIQDKTGVLDGKIWDSNSLGIDDFDALDYIDIIGDVTSFAGAMQVSIKRVRKAGEGEYNPADYLPVSENSADDMYRQLCSMIGTVKNSYLQIMLKKLFVEDEEFIREFQGHSAAKTVHHGFIGGLMEHTLSVARLCEYMAGAYPILKRIF